MKKIWIIAGIAVLAAAITAAVLIFNGREKPVDVPLRGEETVRLEVGGTCSFAEEEKQSIPYRWRYTISDESLMALTIDEYRDHSPVNVMPGGDRGTRRFEFTALAPGRCVITLRYEDIRDAQEYSDERIYTIEITGESSGTQPSQPPAANANSPKLAGHWEHSSIDVVGGGWDYYHWFLYADGTFNYNLVTTAEYSYKGNYSVSGGKIYFTNIVFTNDGESWDKPDSWVDYTFDVNEKGKDTLIISNTSGENWMGSPSWTRAG